MTRIARLDGIPPAAPGQVAVDRALCGKGIETIEDLLACVGKDTAKGVAQVSQETGVSQEFLITLLLVEILGGARPSGEPQPFRFWRWLNGVRLNSRQRWTSFKIFCQQRASYFWSEMRRLWFGLKLIWLFPKRFWLHLNWLWHERLSYWPDLLLIILPLALIALGLQARSVLRAQAQQVVVKKEANLKAFRLINKDDLELVSGSTKEDAFTNPEKLSDRYSLVAVGPGETLHEGQLVPPEIARQLQDRQLLSVPVKANAFSTALGPVTHVRLLLSPRAPVDKPLGQSIFDDVILLAIEKQGENTSIVVALTEDTLKKMQPLLGFSDVFVLHPLQGK
jgi:hypothetical protein